MLALADALDIRERICGEPLFRLQAPLQERARLGQDVALTVDGLRTGQDEVHRRRSPGRDLGQGQFVVGKEGAQSGDRGSYRRGLVLLHVAINFAGSSSTPVTADSPQAARRWGGFICSIWRRQSVRVAPVSPVFDVECRTQSRNHRRF